MDLRRRIRAPFLASTSFAALLLGGAAPAYAACYTGPFPTNFTGTTAGICVTNTNFIGTLTNSGTITTNGIVVTNSAIGNSTAFGGIVDLGTLTGGITIDITSSIRGGTNAISVFGPSAFTGNISNAGTISGVNTAIKVFGVSTFAGSIINSGSISALHDAVITAERVSTFTGGITNSGTLSILVGGTGGIVVALDSSFGGSISNSGAISGGTRAINVNNVSLFSGGITNSGSIAGSRSGISLVGVSTFGGGISNAGTISAAGMAGVAVGGIATFQGGITNSQTISGPQDILIQNVTTFLGGISNSGTLKASGDGIVITSTSVFGTTNAGGITNSGTITVGGIAVNVGGVSNFYSGITNSGTGIISASTGVSVFGGTFTGAIANAGSISGNRGVHVSQVAVFGSSSAGGGISNSGTIQVSGFGIDVDNSSTFLGGVTNSGTITATAGVRINAVTSFQGGISNGGSISALNYGIEIISVPTFQGGISNNGTINVQNGSGILVQGASIQGGITNSGTISALNMGISIQGSTINGAIADSGTIAGGIKVDATSKVVAAGSAAIAITGPKFTGGLTNLGSISGQTGIKLSSVSTFGGGIVNSGTVTGVSGIVVGSGVTFAGGLGLFNSGTIGGSGGTAIDASAATSPFTINQNAGLISGAIKLSASADVLNINGGTIAGNIIGSGASDTVNFTLGSGSMTYGPAFAFSGINQVNFNTGTIVLDGVNSATNVTVGGGSLQVGDAANPGATLTSVNPVNVLLGTLSGYGTVAGGVSVGTSATLAPGGATVGTLHITGNLTFNSGSTYAVTVTPTTASDTVVSGTASLTGGTVRATLQGAVKHQSVILESSGLGGTQFAGLTSTNVPAGFAASLAYVGNNVLLDINAVLGGGASGGLNGNQQNVVSSINNVFNSGGTLPPAFLSLFGLSGANLGNALSLLSGEGATGAQQAGFQMMTGFLGMMTDPYLEGRGGGSGGGANGFATENGMLPPDVASAYAAVFKASPTTATPFEQRWNVWGGAFGGSNRTDGDPAVGSRDLTARAAGFAAGADYRLSPSTTLGFALAGGGTSWSLAQGLGGGRSDAFAAGVYGKTTAGPAYLAASFGYAQHWMSTSRTAFAADQLTAKFGAQSYGGRAEAGYRFAMPVIAITPYAAVQAQAFVTPTYSETDLSGGNFGLTYTGRTATATRGEAGARFDRTMAFDPTTLLMLRGRLGYAHDWVSDPTLAAVFQALPTASFLVTGAAPARDLGLASAGAELRFASGWSLAAKVDGEFASHSQTYTGTGTVRFTW